MTFRTVQTMTQANEAIHSNKDINMAKKSQFNQLTNFHGYMSHIPFYLFHLSIEFPFSGTDTVHLFMSLNDLCTQGSGIHSTCGGNTLTVCVGVAYGTGIKLFGSCSYHRATDSHSGNSGLTKGKFLKFKNKQTKQMNKRKPYFAINVICDEFSYTINIIF